MIGISDLILTVVQAENKMLCICSNSGNLAALVMGVGNGKKVQYFFFKKSYGYAMILGVNYECMYQNQICLSLDISSLLDFWT